MTAGARWVHAGALREQAAWIGALTRNAQRVSIAWAPEDPIAHLAMDRALHELLAAALYVELDGVATS